ncbi:hypothetical protein HPHPH28_1297 [Helicobacter pylori Hp H-28]|nr:hypothetical protein HPHPH28_1297 [Helicobacter pylori Hp H-28]
MALVVSFRIKFHQGLKDWCLSSYHLALRATPLARSLNFL